MSTADAIIIGGGLHGCSTALHLALRGLKVLVIEKDHVARHASGVNAGGVRQLGRHTAEIPLSVIAMQMWHRIAELVDDDCGFESHGQVKVAENQGELQQLQERVTLLQGLGFAHEELIDATELRRLVPAIAGHCCGAIVSRGDGAALPFRTTQAFRRKAQSLGVRFIEGTEVTGLRRVGGNWQVETARERHSTGIVVNAAGAWADRIAAMLGETVPLQAVALMLMVTEAVPRFLQPVLGAAGRPLSFKQYANGTVLIGGGHRGRADLASGRTDLDFRALAISAGTVCELFPGVRGAGIVRAWAGIEGRLPDEIPVIGPSAVADNVWHAFGFCGHGFQLGPAVGAVLAERIVTGHSNLSLAAFDIARFAGAGTSQPSASALESAESDRGGT